MANPDTNASASGTSTDTSQRSSGMMDKVRERATAQLSTQKDKATDGLGSVAQMVRQGTQQLRDQHHETLAGYVEKAADRIDQLSQQLRDKDVSELVDDAQRLARRQPAVFIGSAFALGVIGARFFKSSSPQQENARYRSGNGDVYGSTTRTGTVRSSASSEYATRPGTPSTTGYGSASNVGINSGLGSGSSTGSGTGASDTTEPGSGSAGTGRGTTGTRSRRSSAGTERS